MRPDKPARRDATGCRGSTLLALAIGAIAARAEAVTAIVDAAAKAIR